MKKTLKGYKKRYFKLSIIAMYSTLHILCARLFDFVGSFQAMYFAYRFSGSHPPHRF